ncbi:MAG: pantoate--beta-alanine ligase [Acidimicrobiales bacterium]|jgi:pantoate--beta-alanine ligase|nr:pantoate--beta-alanine ligase [Acidimicrobiales bacterium]
MRTETTIAATRAVLDEARAAGRTIGFVPTMGYLHNGHASLARAAVEACDLVVMSIFVNPLQFGAGEDLAAYPRDLERDLAIADAAGVGLVFAPPVEEMYPAPIRTSVSVAGVSAPLEGASRPGHFDGVATVVAKLFSIVGPCRAFFGEKDFQQLAVVRRMATDLSMPVDVVGCPTVREPDGLAMSSRNVYLSPEERAQAPTVHRALQAGGAAISGGERSAARVQEVMAAVMAEAPLGRVDYLAVVDAATFEVPEPLAGDLRLLAAVRFGRARLIDNVGVVAP